MSDLTSVAPLDILEAAIGKEVIVRVKTEQTVHGTLAGYDQHLNVTLIGIDGSSVATATDDLATDLEGGPLVIRGQMVVSITQPSVDAPVASEITVTDDTTGVEQATDDEEGAETNETLTADLATLQEHLTKHGLDVQFNDESKELVVEKLGVTYHIQPGHVDGDGPHRKQIEQLIID